MRIAVCRPQVPFARGGVEIFADDLVAELRARGHDADLVTVPFKWYPGARVLTQAFLWRLLDLEEDLTAARTKYIQSLVGYRSAMTAYDFECGVLLVRRGLAVPEASPGDGGATAD